MIQRLMEFIEIIRKISKINRKRGKNYSVGNLRQEARWYCTSNKQSILSHMTQKAFWWENDRRGITGFGTALHKDSKLLISKFFEK